MKVFFDNCLPPTLADTLDGFLRHQGHSAHHIKDLHCGRDATDLQWIEMLGNHSDQWMVITGDLRIYKNPAERVALRQANLFGFVMAPAFSKMPMNQRASLLLWRWPDMEQAFKLFQPPALIELPANRASRLRPL